MMSGIHKAIGEVCKGNVVDDVSGNDADSSVNVRQSSRSVALEHSSRRRGWNSMLLSKKLTLQKLEKAVVHHIREVHSGDVHRED
jgi:hypothetical protein